MEDISKISPDVPESLNKALYGSAFGNYDAAHLFLDREANPDKDESPTLSDKIIAGDDTRDVWVKIIPFGGVLYDHIYRGIRTKDSFEKLYGVNLLPYQWAWFCGPTDSQKAALEKLQDKNKKRLAARRKKSSALKPPLVTFLTPDENAHPIFKKVLEDLQQGMFDLVGVPDELLGEKGKDTDFSDCGEHGCGECDKNCKLAGNKEAAKPTCADCSNIDGCSTDERFPCCPEFTEKQIPTCADCTSRNEDLTLVTGSGITLCSSRQTHVPLTSPACDWFVQASKGEAEPEPNETLQEKTKTIAETISDLYYQIASLDSQKDCLKAASEELKDLVLNCPACDSHIQVIDALNDENEKLCDTFLEQDFKLRKVRKELLAEKSWRIGMNGKLANRDSLIDDLRNCNDRSAEVITNLQKKVYEQSKEIEAHCKIADKESEVVANLQRRLQASERERDSWKSSLSDAEFALGAREVTIDVLTKKNADLLQDYKNENEQAHDMHNQLHRAEKELEQLRAYKHSASNDEKVREAIIFEQQKELKRSKQIYLFMYAAQFSVDIADLTSRQRADAETLYELGLQRKMN